MSNLKLAIELCTKLYNKLEPHGIFPALTGGTLYKEGERKDIDIVLYTKMETGEIIYYMLEDILAKVGVVHQRNFGRVIKCFYKNIAIDFILPQFEGVYPCP